MRILFVGDSGFHSTSRFYPQALAQLGHEVLCWKPDYFKTTNPRDYWYLKVHKQPSPKRILKSSYKFLSLCQEYKWDLVFVFAENYIPDTALTACREYLPKGAKVIYHSHDNNFARGILKPPNFLKTLRYYDVVFTTKSQNVRKYQQQGQRKTIFLPSAYDPSVHRPVRHARSRYLQQFDVGFIGTFDDSRIDYLDKAGWDRTWVWGNGWRGFKEYRKHKSHIKAKAIYCQEFADAISHTKCSLGLLREEAQDLHTQRTFEIPACGSLQFCPRNNEVLSFFEDEKEIVCFNDSEELKDKLDFYLAHESKRAKLARAGYERVIRDKHRYSDRVQTLLKSLNF